MRIPFDPKPHPEPEYGRICALCSQPMGTLRVGSIKLETCPHGTWFDHEEVKRAAELLEDQRIDKLRGHDLVSDLLRHIERWMNA